MTIASTGELVEAARAAGGGLGAFNVIGLEHAEGIVAGAERSGTPVVLQVSENTVAYHGGRLAPIGQGCTELAGAAAVPVAVHLDHATTPELCAEAMALGFGSVMFDGSGLDYQDNVTATAAVVADAHRRGVFVEAELGEIGGKNGVHAPDARTDPREA
ncbi:MAG: class II fructose-bisphosphate aldolase, partial [Acidimicrobiales bacterium]